MQLSQKTPFNPFNRRMGVLPEAKIMKLSNRSEVHMKADIFLQQLETDYLLRYVDLHLCSLPASLSYSFIMDDQSKNSVTWKINGFKTYRNNWGRLRKRNLWSLPFLQHRF
jgi:hypothetical protein